MIKDPKSVDNVGGESNADLIFQLAIDDASSLKDWVQIAKIVGDPVTPDAAQRWFEAITESQKRDRWSEKEESILRSLIFPNQELQNGQIYKLFQNRSKKAVINKMSKLRNEKKHKLSNNKNELYQPQKKLINFNEKPTRKRSKNMINKKQKNNE